METEDLVTLERTINDYDKEIAELWHLLSITKKHAVKARDKDKVMWK
jgi:hypothetical protein